MLTGISKAVRSRIAIAFIAIYAVCLLAPGAALAFNGVSCLTEHSVPQAHSHASDAAHAHGDQHDHSGPADSDGDKSASSKCCGMIFCSGALAPDLAVALAPVVLSARTSIAAWQDFTGLPPHKLIRPPRLQS